MVGESNTYVKMLLTMNLLIMLIITMMMMIIIIIIIYLLFMCRVNSYKPITDTTQC
jgi:hypothetical protein